MTKREIFWNNYRIIRRSYRQYPMFWQLFRMYGFMAFPISAIVK